MRKGLQAALSAVAAALIVLAGTSVAVAGTPRPLFASNDMIHITVKGAIMSLPRSKTAVLQSVPGSITVQGSEPETLPVVLSLRGNTRRLLDTCSFPPLRVEFPDKPGGKSLFKGQKGLKLVTHCQSSPDFQQHILLEYAAYRLYNQMTPYSFNARLATVDYVDDKGRAIASRVGFFLEDISDVAKRNDVVRFKTFNRVPVAQLGPRDAARFALFEDMISNLDWAMTAGPAGTDCCHNSRLLAAEGSTTNLIPVPYDFDYSGLVDAPYAVPPVDIKISNVRVRRYRGYCRHNSDAQAVAADLVAHRASLLAVLDQTPKLDDATRRKAASYLGEFFNQISTPEGLAKLEESCIK